ncbi:MAG: 50S ribosomal protein L9 [Firmicutes bacterium HGW-Firmicutes-15]|nr:MAG: 50S ribosomal protein L9 [Firmicutes bacterium HGW-Firmicutes-15]
MKVILTQEVKKLGLKGQVLEVSDGYARNFLIPQGLAEEATKTKLKEIQEKGVKEEKKKSSEKENAEALKMKLHGKKIEIKVKAGAGDKLFGAVTVKEIADILQKEFKVSIDKKKIDVGEPIKHLGQYKIKLKIYPSVQAEVILIVAPE